jgi:hypothetical protein
MEPMMQNIKQEEKDSKKIYLFWLGGGVSIKMDVYGSSKYVANFKKTQPTLQQLANSVRTSTKQRPNVDNVETRTKNVFRSKQI